MLLLCLCLLHSLLSAQQLDSLALHRIADKLVQQELAQAPAGSRVDGHCLRDRSGHLQACFSAHSSPAWVSDFNHDGIADALFCVEELHADAADDDIREYRLLLLDAQQNISHQFAIAGSGPFLHGDLLVQQVSAGRIDALLYQKGLSQQGHAASADRAIPLSFYVHNGVLHEASYQSCPLAAMKKQIFRRDQRLRVHSERQLDDLYNEEYTERVIAFDDSCRAALRGCEDLLLTFAWHLRYDGALHQNAEAIKQLLLGKLRFVEQHTLFRTLLQENLRQLESLNTDLILPNRYGNTSVKLRLPDGWLSTLSFGGNAAQGSDITLVLEKPMAQHTMPPWQSLIRKAHLTH